MCIIVRSQEYTTRKLKKLSGLLKEVKSELEKDILTGVKDTLAEIKEDTSKSNQKIEETQADLAEKILANIESTEELQIKQKSQIERIMSAINKMYMAYTGEEVEGPQGVLER